MLLLLLLLRLVAWASPRPSLSLLLLEEELDEELLDELPFERVGERDGIFPIF